ncbi:ATP cone domain-containing protein [Oceanimonas sp. NS1]|nr:ATP cone domain-containing protein [Oceanimonas sp. NS1]
MNKHLLVTKRSGAKEPIDLDKIHRVITWAAEGLDNVSVSQVELRSHIQFYDGIRTEDIHETIIKAAADLISEQSPDYQYLAARLAMFHLRKKAYGEFEAAPLP